MAQIHGKDTGIEVKVRLWLFHQGIRYRKNVRDLPGKPDIVLRKYRSVIFVHGCFWHQHPYCRIAHIPNTRTEYWIPKLNRNIINDQKHYEELERLGWNVIVIWECEVKKDFEINMQRIKNELEENYLKTTIRKLNEE